MLSGAVIQIPMRPQKALRNEGNMQVAHWGFCYLARGRRSLKFDSALTAQRVIRALPDHMELYVIEKESLNINKLEHVLIEKVEQLFRDIL
jgi:hypothetical protein